MPPKELQGHYFDKMRALFPLLYERFVVRGHLNHKARSFTGIEAAEVQSSHDDPYGFSHQRYRLPRLMRSPIDSYAVKSSLRHIIMLELAARIDRGEDVLDMLLEINDTWDLGDADRDIESMLCSFIGILLEHRSKLTQNIELNEQAMEFLERAREVAEGISFAEEKLKWMVRVPTGQEIAKFAAMA